MKRENYLSIMRHFFDQVNSRLPKGKGMGSELGDLLGKSENTIYRKVRGEIGIPVEEYIMIARHFGIELPIFDDQKNMRFSKNLLFKDPEQTEIAFRHFQYWLNRIEFNEKGKLFLVSPELNPIHFINNKDLLPLLLWEWQGLHKFNSFQEMERSQRFPYNSHVAKRTISKLTQGLSITEFLHMDSFRIHTQRIEKALDLEYISSSDALNILEGLKTLSKKIELTAQNSQSEKGLPYHLYLLDENCSYKLFIHEEKGNINSVLLGTGRGNYMESDSLAYCDTVQPIVSELKENGSLISGCNRNYRTDFFKKVRQHIQKVQKRIQSDAA